MLKIQNVSKQFYRTQAVEDVSFELESGKITGLLGPNGAGKTTLIRMMNQIFLPDEGSILFKDKTIHQDDVRLFGYLPEERGLYRSMTVKNHCLFISKIKGMRNEDAKKAMDFWFDKFEIQDWKNKKISSLSKGMAQKVQFINTVLHDPEVLILDEPFSGFDPVNARLIEKEIKRFKKEGKTIVLSTHDMNSVESLCDKAVIINDGKVIANDSILNLKKSDSEIYEMEFSGHLLAFVNALWAGYELIDKQDLGDNRNYVLLKMRNENDLNELLKTVMNTVKIESVRKKMPSMNDVFINLTAQKGGSNE